MIAFCFFVCFYRTKSWSTAASITGKVEIAKTITETLLSDEHIL